MNDRSSAQPLLQVDDLRVSLPTARGWAQALRGVSWRMERGQTVGLIGESGSGKSLTALALMGLLPERARVSGSIALQGQELVGLPEPQLCQLRGARMAMIFQEPMTALNPLMTVGQQISEVLQLKKLLPHREADARAVQWLADTGIDDPDRRFSAYPHQLSGGQRQRAMMAMALASEPQLLLADEPTTALDASLRLQMLQLLADLQQKTGMAVLLITHDLSLVRHFADRVAVMEKGRLVEQGSLSAVFQQPQHPYTQSLLSAVPIADPRKRRFAEDLAFKPITSPIFPLGHQPAPCHPVHVEPAGHDLHHSGRGGVVRHRGRSAVCRHGAFRQKAHPSGLVQCGHALLDAELFWSRCVAVEQP